MTNYYQSKQLYISPCAGLLSVLRLVTHHPETIMVEYKSTTQLLLKQVGNEFGLFDKSENDLEL